MYVGIEGPDGVGKTSVARRIYEKAVERGIPTRLTHEPGDSPLGKFLRSGLKDVELQKDTHPMSRRLMFEAARISQQRTVIEPALREGKLVLSDRVSVVSNQCYGLAEGTDMEFLRRLESLDTDRVSPDMLIFLSAPVQMCVDRQDDDKADLAEQDRELFERVHAEYALLERAANVLGRVTLRGGFHIPSACALATHLYNSVDDIAEVALSHIMGRMGNLR